MAKSLIFWHWLELDVIVVKLLTLSKTRVDQFEFLLLKILNDRAMPNESMTST